MKVLSGLSDYWPGQAQNADNFYLMLKVNWRNLQLLTRKKWSTEIFTNIGPVEHIASA